MVGRYYASGNSGQVLYDVNHLQGLKMINNNIEGIHNSWDMVLSGLVTRPAEKLLQHLYFMQVCDFKPLEADIAFYKEPNGMADPSSASSGSGTRRVGTSLSSVLTTCRRR
mgnify:CR=1 FL=1